MDKRETDKRETTKTTVEVERAVFRRFKAGCAMLGVPVKTALAELVRGAAGPEPGEKPRRRARAAKVGKEAKPEDAE